MLRTHDVCDSVCVRVRVCVCMRACVRACVCVHIQGLSIISDYAGRNTLTWSFDECAPDQQPELLGQNTYTLRSMYVHIISNTSSFCQCSAMRIDVA